MHLCAPHVYQPLAYDHRIMFFLLVFRFYNMKLSVAKGNSGGKPWRVAAKTAMLMKTCPWIMQLK